MTVHRAVWLAAGLGLPAGIWWAARGGNVRSVNEQRAMPQALDAAFDGPQRIRVLPPSTEFTPLEGDQ